MQTAKDTQIAILIAYITQCIYSIVQSGLSIVFKHR